MKLDTSILMMMLFNSVCNNKIGGLAKDSKPITLNLSTHLWMIMILASQKVPSTTEAELKRKMINKLKARLIFFQSLR